VKPGTKRFGDVWLKLCADTSNRFPALLWRHNRSAWNLTFYARSPNLLVTVTGREEIRQALCWLQGLGEEVA
jgi:hypothetical protein